MNQFRLRDDFANISATFKRVNNILRDESINGQVDTSQLKMFEEKTLWETFLFSERSATELIEKKNLSLPFATEIFLMDCQFFLIYC